MRSSEGEVNFRTLALIMGASLFCLGNLYSREELPILHPIPEPIQEGDLTLHLELFVRMPETSKSELKTRINLLKPAVDGSDGLYVSDQRGVLYVIEAGNIRTYLDVREYLPDFDDSRGLGGGLNSFAFHPEFERNGLFYTVHSETPGVKEPDFIGPAHEDRESLESILVEWKARDPNVHTFQGEFREMMRVRFPLHIHTLQDITFNPHAKVGDADYGLLYIGVGEGGSVTYRQYNNIHRLDSLLGTVARIDPLGSNSANGKYGFPADNPWASDGDDSTLGEIWAYGFRNPHRLIWDAGLEGRLFITDIGELTVEEINLGGKGNDYGWPFREGTFEFQLDPDKIALLPLPENDGTRFDFTYPVAQFDHTQGNAISGGYVYRGKRHPLLRGKYLFGEITQGFIFYLDASELESGQQALIKRMRLTYEGKEITLKEIVGGGRVDLRFGQDNQNEIYLMEKGQGRIFKIGKVTRD